MIRRQPAAKTAIRAAAPIEASAVDIFELWDAYRPLTKIRAVELIEENFCKTRNIVITGGANFKQPDFQTTIGSIYDRWLARDVNKGNRHPFCNRCRKFRQPATEDENICEECRISFSQSLLDTLDLIKEILTTRLLVKKAKPAVPEKRNLQIIRNNAGTSAGRDL